MRPHQVCDRLKDKTIEELLDIAKVDVSCFWSGVPEREKRAVLEMIIWSGIQDGDILLF
jgi:hypothetical protein